MYSDKYYVPKDSGTYANVLEAFGLAKMLKEITSKDVLIEDFYSCYILSLPIQTNQQMVQQTRFFTGVPYIKGKDEKPRRDTPDVIDFGHQIKLQKDYWAFVNPKGKKTKKPTEKEIQVYKENNEQSHPDWDIVSAIQDVDALPSYTASLKFILDNRSGFHIILDEALWLYSENTVSNGDRFEESRRRLKTQLGKLPEEVTVTKLFSPSQVKGTNTEKANTNRTENIKIHPLRSWLYMMGAYSVLIPKSVNIGSVKRAKWDDRKILVLSPSKIDYGRVAGVFKGFRNEVEQNTSIKIDIGCIINATQRLIKYIRDYAVTEESDRVGYVSPWEYVAGFHLAYLKLLGNNYIVSNLAFIELPVFIRIDSHETGERWIDILKDHYKVFVGKRVNGIFFNSDLVESGIGLEILQLYRHFITTGNLDSFLDCLCSHAVFLSQEATSAKEGEVKFVLSNNSLNGRLLEQFFQLTKEFYMAQSNKKPIALILQSEGFRNIAKAIRNCTIRPLNPTNAEYKKLYGDTRYGMAQDFKRKSPYRDELVTYLTEFLSSYNARTARVEELYGETRLKENPKLRRHKYSTQDMEEVISFIDDPDYGPDTIGRLLMAYGYAADKKTPKEAGADNQPDSDDVETEK